MEASTRNSFLRNKTYDLLKLIAQIFLPVLGALYFVLELIWGLPNAEKVVGIIVIIDAFLGPILGFASKSYNNSDAKYDGQIEVVIQEDFSKQFLLELNSDPYELEKKKQVVFRVNPTSPE